MDTNPGEPNEVNILIGCTGSVATIKLPNLLQGLLDLTKKNGFKLNVSTYLNNQLFPDNVKR